MKKNAIIMAGGTGSRAGKEMPKQLVELLGIPMLWWSVRAFHQADPDTRIILVMHPDYISYWEKIAENLPEEDKKIEIEIAPGGSNRGESVRNGLRLIPNSKEEIVAVHDAARPLVSPQIITDSYRKADEGMAVPVAPVTDSLRRIERGGVSKAVDRSAYMAVQTPQTARADILHAAYELEERPEFTDDASRVEILGREIHLIPGNPENIKVTNPKDFAIAEMWLKE